MINFIIYEDESRFRDKYFAVIDNYFRGSKIAYEVTEIREYSKIEMDRVNKAGENRIYILDIEVPGKSGLDFAREIRERNDWQSQIIIVTSHDDLKDYDLQADMLALAFISKFYSLEKKLNKAIKRAYEIITSNKMLEFKAKGAIYQLQLADVLYIEKESQESMAMIVARKSRYEVNMSLLEIEKKINNDPRFFKLSRNCIINTNRVSKYDIEEDVIYFGKEYVERIPISKKKELKDRLNDEQIRKEA